MWAKTLVDVPAALRECWGQSLDSPARATNPKNRRAPSQELDRYLVTFNLDGSLVHFRLGSCRVSEVAGGLRSTSWNFLRYLHVLCFVVLWCLGVREEPVSFFLSDVVFAQQFLASVSECGTPETWKEGPSSECFDRNLSSSEGLSHHLAGDLRNSFFHGPTSSTFAEYCFVYSNPAYHC